MFMNWISKIQEKQDTIPELWQKKYHIPVLVLKGLQLPYTQNPWPNKTENTRG